MSALRRPSGRYSPWLWRGALWLVVGVGVVRIVSTYQIFNNVFDEPAHLACGMEWLDHGRYGYEPQHPPLSRIFTAVGPYLDGSRSHGTPASRMYDEGLAILYAGDYWRTLSLARAGILPFFVLACLMLWMWTKHSFGSPAALVAVLLFTNLPPVLGHAGLATTDMALTATLTAALYALVLYLQTPSLKRAAVLGLALGIAVASKFTALPFFPVALAAFVTLLLAKKKLRLPPLRIFGRHILACCAIVLFVTWGAYRFSLDPIVLPTKDFADPDPVKTSRLEALPPAVVGLLSRPVPEGQLLRGIGSVYLHAGEGHPSYLFGEYRTTGWWYFFPVVLVVKTPLSFLLLAGIGCTLLIQRAGSNREPLYALAPLVFAAAIFLFSLSSKINIGVRHILILYPLLSITAAYGVVALWRAGRLYRLAAAGLILWLLLATARAHPDYLAYFNEFAGSRPERIVAESDLDWGQDLNRASIRLRQLGAKDVAVSYFGKVRLDKSGLPRFEPLVSVRQPQHWALISVRMFLELQRKARINPEAAALYTYLHSQQPVERIGKTLLLYRFHPAADGRAQAVVDGVNLGVKQLRTVDAEPARF